MSSTWWVPPPHPNRITFSPLPELPRRCHSAPITRFVSPTSTLFPRPPPSRPRSPPTMPYRTLLLLLLFAVAVESHEHHGDGDGGGACEGNPQVTITSGFMPGVVTVDGRADDWEEMYGSELDLRPALDWDVDKAYPGGSIVLKSIHDGTHVYFLLKVSGEYMYTKGDSNRCFSVALMFQVGENATYNNMGGCKEMPNSCTEKSCRGHEVDIMHFSIGTAIPGRLYGSNPLDNNLGHGDDRFGHLVDLYAWNPHCRFVDGKGPGNNSNAKNDWQGAWWHSTMTSHSGFVEDDSPYSTAGGQGTYYFEFSRPLRTNDRLQQDVQFAIGQSNKMSVAFWYPSDGNPWSGSQHYSVSCDWLPIEIMSPSSSYWSNSKGISDATNAMALIIAIVSLIVTILVGYRVFKSKTASFTPINQL